MRAIDYLRPTAQKVTELLYIDDLKISASSESKLNRVMESTKSAMEDVGLQWNPKKCAIAHVQRGFTPIPIHDTLGLRVDEEHLYFQTSKRAISTSSWVSWSR